MKKIISLVLTACMLMSLGVFTSFGEVEPLVERCIDAYIEYEDDTNGYELKDYEYVECKVYGEADGVVFFRAYIACDDEVLATVCSEQRIGGYIFTYGYVVGPVENPTGLFVLKDGKAITALEAYNEQIVSIDTMVNIVGATKDPYDVEGNVAKKLNFPPKGSGENENPPYLYREIYAYYSEPNRFSAADPEYVVVFASSGPGEPAAPAQRAGDYAVGSLQWYVDSCRYGLYVYVPKTKTLYTIVSAVEEAKIEGIENAFLNIGKQGGIIGDVDKDGDITVRDATAIQKIIAGMSVSCNNAYNENVEELIRDFNRDNALSVRDATAIQKYIVSNYNS